MTPENLPAPALVSLLKTSSDVQEKARACQQLALVGGPDAVPALAALLADEYLSAYARSALETIPSPLAGAALVAALPRLEGRLLTGAIDSLGVRRERAAVSVLAALASDDARGAADAALAALGKIATAEALAAITKALRAGPTTRRLAAAHAALAAAAGLRRAGDTKSAEPLLREILAAPLPAHLHAAARSQA